MNEELLKNLGSLGLSRSVQQKLKKIQSQQLDKLLQQYGAFDSGESENLTNREKLRRKIREKEQVRINVRTETGKRDTNKQLEPPLTEEEKLKRHKNRMKRLREKYGQVSEEQYYEALRKTQGVETDKLTRHDSEALRKYFNIVDLYNHQHRSTDVEKEIDLDDF